MTEDLLKPSGVNYFDQYDSAEEEVAPARTSPLVDELTGDMMFQGAFERLKQRDALQKSEEDSRDSITVVTEDDTIREMYAKGQQVQNGYSMELGAFIEAEKAQNQEQIAERSKGLTELSKGFTQGTLGATSMLGAALRQYGETSESETLGRVGEFVQYLSELERAKVAPPRVNQFGDAKSFNDFMDYFWAKLGEAGGSTTGIIAGGVVGGIPGAGLTAMSMGIGEVRNELEAVGVTDPKMLESYSYIAGSVVGALDALVPVSIMQKLTGNSKRELAKYMIRRVGVEMAKGTGREGITEALQETVIIAASSAAQGEQNFVEIMRNAKDGIVAQRERIGEAALAGMIGGSGFGTVSGVGQEFTRPRTEDQVQRETKQDMDPFAEFFRAQPIRTTAMEERLAGQEAEGQAAPEGLVQAQTYAESREQRAGDVLQFIRSRGGLKPAGELEGLDANRYPGLVNQKGLSADQMREQLVEAGYLEESGPDQPAVTTPADVYDLVQRAISGERIVPADMQQQDQAAFEAEDQRTYEANLAHDEQVMVLADIDAADQEYGDTGFRDLYLRMPRAQRIEAIERVRSGEDTLDVIEEMTLRGDNIAEVASMMARRGLTDEQTARLREIVSEQAPDLIDGLDELLAVLPKRQKREAAARPARGGRQSEAAPVQQATAPAQQRSVAQAAPAETVSSLMRKTKPELVSLARERGVPVKAKATKQQIAADVMAKAERDKREPAQREDVSRAVQQAVATLEAQKTPDGLTKAVKELSGQLSATDWRSVKQLLQERTRQRVAASSAEAASVMVEPVESLSPEAEIVAENLNALFHRGDRNGDIEAWLEESREIVAELQRLPAREAVNVAVDFMGELPAAVRRSRAASARAVQQRFDSLYNSWAMARHVSMPSMAEQGAFTDDTIINELDDAIWRAALAMTPERVRKQMQDRIMLTQVAPNIMLNANGQSPITQSEAFRRWFADSKVVDENGLPLIVYHGTTHDIEIFRPVRANFENDFGAGYYFSNSTADVRENYAGEGPDLTQRIELQAERIMFEIENVINSDGIDAALEQFGLTQEQRSENVMEMAREVARRDLFGGTPNTVPVYLSFQNPVILGGTGETYIGSGLEVSDERRDEIREDVLEETKEQNLDEDQIEELIMERIDKEMSWTEPTGGVAGMITHIRSLDYADMDPDKLANDLVDYMDEGGRAADIIEIMKRSEGLAYATDDNGALVSNEVIRSALEAIGYDGIIDRTVNEKFGSESGRRNPMAGMDENTVHYIAFKPTQIKSAIGNRGTFDPNDPRIVFSVDSNSELLLTVDQRSVDEEQVRRGVKTLLAMGRSVSISGNVRAAIFNNIRSSRAVIPRNLPVGYLSRIEPGKNKRVKAHFTMEDGSSHVMEIGREQLLGLRAFYQSSNGALPRGIYFARFNTSGKIAPSFIGELRHESIHALRRGNLIPDKVWSQLVSHAKNLRVLDVVNSDYLEATGRKATDESATFLTLNDIYNDYYQGRADLDETLDQEAVAHMAELYSHGIWEQSEIAPVQAILDGIFAGQYSGNPQQMFSIRGFHGSPHDFDRFDMSRIGTGEGAQAFGHGLYFAENEMVAGTYRDNLSAQTMTINGFPFQPRNHAITQIVGRNLSDLKAARQELAQYAERGADNPYSDVNDAYRIIDAIDEGIFDVGTQGALYEVEIDVEPEQLLDWDLPLSKQGTHVQEFFDSALAEDEVYQAWKRNGAIANVNASLLYDRLSGPRGMQRGNVDGRETASQKLREAGIPGIRYLDQGSRTPGFSSLKPAQLDARIETLRSDIASGLGDQEKMRGQLANLERERDSYPTLTRNIVVFDDSLVKITKKNGKPVTAEERQDAIDQMFSLRSGSVTETEAFKRWFGASKVVDENGEPLVVYHGTVADFEAFDIEKTGVGRSQDTGFYFTPEAERASRFASSGYGEGGRVIPVYLKIENPYVVDDPAKFFNQLDRDIGQYASRDKFINYFESRGFDGLRLNFEGKLSSLVAFRPEQIKSIYNRGTFDPTDPRISFALRGFYSPAIRAAEQLKQERGTGQQFWSMISKAPGVRRDELDWMGLEEFLADKTSITKDEVLSFMRAHQVELDEKVLGGEGQIDRTADVISREPYQSETAQGQMVIFEANGERLEYLLREQDGGWIAYRWWEGNPISGMMNTAEAALHVAQSDAAQYGSRFEAEDGTKFSGAKVPGGDNYREFKILLPGWEYSEPHFGGPVLVHFRADDRIGPNGERIFFIHEVQATGHQRGRKRGYQTPETQSKLAELAEKKNIANGELGPVNAELQEIRDISRKKFIEKIGKQPEPQILADVLSDFRRTFHQAADGETPSPRIVNYKKQALAAIDELRNEGVLDRQNELNKKRKEITDQLASYRVQEIQLNNLIPDAPFKGDLWLELALKRALLYASENGYDAVSWARSDQIAKAVGGDAEALSVQYDQKIGSFLKKYTKKWGGKVEEASFVGKPSAEGYAAILESRGVERAVDTTDGVNPILRITPEMRSSVMEGQPMTIRRDPNERQPIVEGLFDREKLLIIISRAALDPVSTLYHESIHALRTLGLFTPSEWKVLTAAAKAQGWLDVPEIKDYQRIYGKPATDENIIEEAVAMAFQRYMRGQQQQPGTIVERLFERVRVFFERVRSAFALRGWAAAEDVFAAVAGGQVADRDGPMGALVEEIEKITSAPEMKPMLETAGRMTDSPARVAQPGLDRPGQSLATLVRRFNRGLGLTVRQGRLSDALKKQAAKAGRRLGGHYNTVSGVVRLRILNELDTLAHEGGHALEGRHKTALEAVKLQHSAELLPLASPGPDALSEGFAEWFRRYITNPAASRRTAPRFEPAFEAFMQRADPRAFRTLQNIRTGYQEWLQAPSAGVIVSNIVSRAGGQLAKFRRIVQEGEVRETIDMFVEKMYTWVIDDLHPIRQTVEGLLAVARKNLNLPNDARLTLKAVNDPYKLLRLARDGYASGHMDLQHGVRPYHQLDPAGPSFHEVLVTAFGGESRAHWRQEAKDRFDSYLASRRMVREWDRYFNGELTALPDKVKKTEHLQNITELERAYPGFAQAAQMLYQFQNNMLQKKLDAGLISQEIYDTLVGRPDYVPVLRDRTDLGQVHSGAPARADKQGILRRFRGSQRDVISPLESIVQDTYDTAMIIARNDAIKALDTLARAAGPDGGAFAERIPSHQMEGTKVNVQEALRLAAREAGVDPADLQAMVQSVDDMLGDNAITTIWRAGEISEKGEAIVYLWEKGKRIPLRLADKEFGRDMLNSILALGSELTPWYISVLSLPATILRTSITASLDFIGANFIRDQVSAWILVDEFTPFVSGVRGIYDDLTAKDIGRIYSSVGGIMGGANTATLHNARIKQEVLDLRKRRGIYFRDAPLSNILRITEFTETGTRLGVFRKAFDRAVKDGMSRHEAAIEAAYAARDYIDFGRHGSKMLAMRRIIPFFNAALQGLDRGVRGVRGKVNNDRIIRDQISPYIKSRMGQPLSMAEKRQLPLATKVWGKLVAVGLLGAAIWMLHQDDDEYEEFSEYMRATHWIFKVDGEWYRVPKPFELGMFSNFMERTMEYVLKDDPLAMERFVAGLQHTVIPPYDVPGIKLPFELAFNHDSFTGRQIVADHLRALPPHLQFNAYASEFGKFVGKQINVSPAYVDHFITGFGASYGRAFLNGTDALTGNYIDPGTAAKDVFDALIGRRFSLEAPRGAQSISQFWDLIGNSTGTYAQAANGYKHYLNKARDPLAASEFLAALTDDQKAYAILHATQTGGRAKYRDLHPLIRAEEVVSIANALRKSLNLNRLEDQDGEALVIRPRERRMAMEILGNLQMREARNGLVAAGVEGWAQKQPMDTQAVIEELAAAAPAVHEQFMEKLREAKLPSYEDVRREWPEVRRRLIEDGENAELSDLYVPEPL